MKKEIKVKAIEEWRVLYYPFTHKYPAKNSYYIAVNVGEEFVATLYEEECYIKDSIGKEHVVAELNNGEIILDESFVFIGNNN